MGKWFSIAAINGQPESSLNATAAITENNVILTTICTFVSIMLINLGIFASSMWMSLFFGLGTVVNIKKSGNDH